MLQCQKYGDFQEKHHSSAEENHTLQSDFRHMRHINFGTVTAAAAQPAARQQSSHSKDMPHCWLPLHQEHTCTAYQWYQEDPILHMASVPILPPLHQQSFIYSIFNMNGNMA